LINGLIFFFLEWLKFEKKLVEDYLYPAPRDEKVVGGLGC
jgi:hypothetical protein